MSEKWILSVQTSLPDFCETDEDLTKTEQTFDSFEEGKAAFIDTLKGYTFSENAMFDGNGNSKALEEFLDPADWEWLTEDDPENYDDDLQYGTLLGFCDAIQTALKGEETDVSVLNAFNMDWWVLITREGDTIYMRGEGDGPINGVKPYIKMNTFDWSEEKHYFLYFDDLLGQDASAELYMDLYPEDQEINDPVEENRELYRTDEEAVYTTLEDIMNIFNS